MERCIVGFLDRKHLRQPARTKLNPNVGHDPQAGAQPADFSRAMVEVAESFRCARKRTVDLTLSHG